MSGEAYTPWDSAEFLDDDEARIEYLKAALAENDPEFFAKAVGNAARGTRPSRPNLAVAINVVSTANGFKSEDVKPRQAGWFACGCACCPRYSGADPPRPHRRQVLR